MAERPVNGRSGWKQDPAGVRKNILAVAMAEFAANGLSGARIDEIAAKTNTSKRMIYYYFGDKEGLYGRVLEEAYREVRARFTTDTDKLVENARDKFGIETPFGGPTVTGLLTLHCPPDQVYALTNFLRDNGAEAVAVAELDYVFSRDNPLFAKFEAGL